MEDDNESVITVDDRKFELLIIPSVETLEQSNKKCRREKVFGLIQKSIECQIQKKILNN